MTVIPLSAGDLSIAAGLIIILAILSVKLELGIAAQILVAAVRTTVQLLLIGLVLKSVFSHVHITWVITLSMIMLIAAGREVMARQQRKFTGSWGAGLGGLSMFLSSFTITILTLTTIIGVDPWYEPRYAIPLLGMMLGNTMTGVALGLDRMTSLAWDQQDTIEARLMLGQSWQRAITDIRRASIRSGLIPIVNSMAAAGIVSLPGMMTGQILAGSPPFEAVKYQILIMFITAGGTGLGTLTAIYLGSHRLFDKRHRLRLDRLRT